MIDDRKHRARGTSLGIGRSVDDAVQSRMNHRPGAHRAGFQGDKHGAAVEAMIAEGLAGGAQSDDLRVSSWVIVAHYAILRPYQYFILIDEDGADGDFASLSGGDGFVEGQLEVV